MILPTTRIHSHWVAVNVIIPKCPLLTIRTLLILCYRELCITFSRHLKFLCIKLCAKCSSTHILWPALLHKHLHRWKTNTLNTVLPTLWLLWAHAVSYMIVNDSGSRYHTPFPRKGIISKLLHLNDKLLALLICNVTHCTVHSAAEYGRTCSVGNRVTLTRLRDGHSAAGYAQSSGLL